MLNGQAVGVSTLGNGGYTLGINNGMYSGEYSDFGFNCVMIWDTALTDAEMVLLNDMMVAYKYTNESMKQYFYDDCSM